MNLVEKNGAVGAHVMIPGDVGDHSEVDALRCQVLQVCADVNDAKQWRSTVERTCATLTSEVGRLAQEFPISLRPRVNGVEEELVQRVAMALNDFMRMEVATASGRSSAEFKIYVDSRLNECFGSVTSTSVAQSNLSRHFDECLRTIEDRFASVEARLDEIEPRCRSELETAIGKVSKQIKTVAGQANSERLSAQQHAESCIAESEKLLKIDMLELHSLIRSQETYFKEARQEKDYIETRCARMVADCQEMLHTEIGKIKEQTDAFSREVDKRVRDMRKDNDDYIEDAAKNSTILQETVQAKVEHFSLDFNERLRQYSKSAEDAFEAAEKAESNSQKAFLRMHAQLENTVDQGSRALRRKIDEATTAIMNSLESNQGKEASGDLFDFEAGFYGLVAREVLSQELKTMIQTATSQLQKVSDDVASRIGLFSDMTGPKGRTVLRT